MLQNKSSFSCFPGKQNELADECLKSLKAYLNVIANQLRSNIKPTGNQQRHQAFKNWSRKIFKKYQEVTLPGIHYLKEDELEELILEMHREYRSKHEAMHINCVLVSEALTKLIQDREQCSYDRATAIGFGKKSTLKPYFTMYGRKI